MLYILVLLQSSNNYGYSSRMSRYVVGSGVLLQRAADAQTTSRSHWRTDKQTNHPHYFQQRPLKSSTCMMSMRDLLAMETEYTAFRHPDLLKGIYAMGFNKPSKIQERALPLLLANP